MSTTALLPHRPAVIYPESDGKPMADNTLQFQWIVTIQGGMDAAFADDPNVFIAGDLLWYPVEGEPKICAAPDIFAAFGRPKGHRGCYKQWVEGGIAPQVVFEVHSPNNTTAEMLRKLRFYERYGVEEYYYWDPMSEELSGWLRHGDELRPIETMNGWVSPRAKIRFELVDGDLRIYGPDGKRFATYVELAETTKQAQREKEKALREREKALRDKEKAQREKEKALRAKEKAQHEKEQAQHEKEQAQHEKEQAQHEKEQAQHEKEQAQHEKEQAQHEKEQAQHEKEQAQHSKEKAQRDKERLAAQLRALGIEPEV